MDLKHRRHFKRYPKTTDVHLYCNNKAIRAETTDYSLTGIGAVIKDADSIRKGDIISLNAREPHINTIGEVVWTQEDRPGVRVGIRNIGPLKGFLSDYRLDDTIIGIQRSQKTGTLVVESGVTVRKMYIKNGDMIFSSSNQDRDRLGIMLLNEGTISIDQYNRALEMMKDQGQRMGTVLVKLGYLEPKGLASAVRRQVEEIILSLFTMEDGKFTLEEKIYSPDEVITLKLSAANLIYKGLKRFNNIDFIRRELPPLERVVHFASDPLDLFQDLRLDDDGMKIIASVDGKKTLGEIISAAHLRTADALKTVYALLSVRMIEARENGGPHHEPPGGIVEELGKVRPQETFEPGLKEMIEEVHREHERLGYYGILGVKDYATPEEIKSAYYTVAKKYHPDMHYHLTDDTLKQKLGDIFSYVYRAYETLSDYHKRREYDRQLAENAPRLISNQEKAKALFDQGRTYLRKKSLSDAELVLAQATYFDGAVAEYHFHYALALSEQGKFKGAEKALEAALRLDPSNAGYLAELGFVFLHLGFPGRARTHFERSLKIAPDNARAQEGIGNISRP